MDIEFQEIEATIELMSEPMDVRPKTPPLLPYQEWNDDPANSDLHSDLNHYQQGKVDQQSAFGVTRTKQQIKQSQKDLEEIRDLREKDLTDELQQAKKSLARAQLSNKVQSKHIESNKASLKKLRKAIAENKRRKKREKLERARQHQRKKFREILAGHTFF